jgi:hypothetical protein
MPRSTKFAPLALLFFTILIGHARAESNLTRPPGTTRYAPMVAQLKSLLAYDKAHGEGRMELSSIGRSVKGREIWMVTLHEPSVVTPTEGQDDTTEAATPPKRLLYLCRQHGHEPASTEGALAFVRDLVKADPDSTLADDLRHVTVYVVPMANPDGAEAFLRHNAHNVDLNRDWLKRTQPETQAYYRAITRIKPDLMTDQHELYPNDTDEDFAEAMGPGSGAKPEVIAACAGTASTLVTSMTAAGFPIKCHWITDNHPPRLAHRYENIVAGVPTILFETNRLSGTGRSVAARGQAHYQFMLTVLRDMAGGRQELLAEAASRTRTDRATLLASRHRTYTRDKDAAPPVAATVPPTVPAAPVPDTTPKDDE